MIADSHSILNRWKVRVCQLVNVHMVNEVKLTAVHTAETLVPNPSAFEDEMAAENFKRYKSTSTAQIPE
jgi:hypothetical protein